MKKIFIALLIAFVSGQPATAQDFKVTAKEYCDRFKLLKDTMDKEFQDIMIRISPESKLSEALRKEIVQLSKEEREKFKEQMERLGEEFISRDHEAGLCGMALEKKYKSFKSTPE